MSYTRSQFEIILEAVQKKSKNLSESSLSPADLSKYQKEIEKLNGQKKEHYKKIEKLDNQIAKIELDAKNKIDSIDNEKQKCYDMIEKIDSDVQKLISSIIS